MLYSLTAIETMPGEEKALTVVINVFDGVNESPMTLIEKACTEYVKTEKGRALYSYNCHSFNLADFEVSVPNSICRKYGFEKVETKLADEIVWDHQFVEDADEFYDEDEE